ncbi:hypothetical protein PG997_012920, partial [Apiospora hydei]
RTLLQLVTIVSFSDCLVAALASVASFASGAAAYADPGVWFGQFDAPYSSAVQGTFDDFYFRFNTGHQVSVWKPNTVEGLCQLRLLLGRHSRGADDGQRLQYSARHSYKRDAFQPTHAHIQEVSYIWER